MQWIEHEESQSVLRLARTIAVLGIKPEFQADRAAFWIPDYLASVGYRIRPVPTSYPDVEEILGEPVFRQVSEIPDPIDIVSVFRRPEDVAAHLDDLLQAQPSVVWFQSGCLDLATAKTMHAAGIGVVCSCIGCTRATIEPTQGPLVGQLAD